ncbi:Hypothetical protein R9X50_00147400 [Acrodontium crateriforme]|uniref:Histidine acid phosphatase n=1 Tax=Acrodontium crateriforme TaxID=150365 RepID=A0AAQ3M573_9PEZI|nr:Hypothetical protein R9X50_00147400 [Acrodontium crateriforme]
MPSTTAFLALAAAVPLALAETLTNETVLGVYMFHRHGDRTAKMTPPANLTTLGYQEVYTSGNYYRGRYIAADAPYRISGINTDVVKQSQIAVSAPADTVLQNSAIGFLQALYPPTGSGNDVETLANGTQVTSPMDGYQLIPVSLVSSGSGSEDNGWLQSASGCANATLSSNEYFSSKEYTSLLSSTQEFYTALTPVLNSTFPSSGISFKNAYTIFDYINVGEIHNASISNYDNLLTNETLFQLRTLADSHEWGLAYNGSDDMRAVAGKVLAGQIVEFLNGTVTGKGKQKLGIQFGAYGTFASFFGLAGLAQVDPTLKGVADYASAMSFELFTNGSQKVSSTNFPSNDDIYVRFLFHNGTTSNISEPVSYPLFGSGKEVMAWNDFTTGMNKFAIGNTNEWCTACGNYTGTCAAYAPAETNSSANEPSTEVKSGNGLSPVINGVIGAMVTLAVVLGLEALILVVGGFKVVSKKSLAGGAAGGHGSNVKA